MDHTGFTQLPLMSATKIFQVAWLTACASVLLYILYEYKPNIKLQISTHWPVALLAISAFMPIASVLMHTPTEPVAIYRAIENCILTVLCISIALLCYPHAKQDTYPFRAIYFGGMFMVTVTIIGIIAFPEYAIFSIGNRVMIAGSIYHSIQLGAMLCVSYLAAVALYTCRSITLAQLLLLAIPCHILLALTLSRSALTLCILGNTAVLILSATSRNGKLAITSVLLLLLTMNVAYLQTQQLIVSVDESSQNIVSVDESSQNIVPVDKSSQNKEATSVLTENLESLSGRDLVFAAAFDKIAQSPWLGIGYVTGVRDFLRERFQGSHWLPPHTHNAYIESILSLGLLGSAPLLIFLLASGLRGFHLFFYSDSHTTKMASVIVGCLLIMAMIELPFGGRFSFLTASLYSCSLFLWRKQEATS